MMSKTNELSFQNDMIAQLQANRWLLGKAEQDKRELALYTVWSQTNYVKAFVL